MVVLRTFIPVISLVVHAVLVALFSYSVHAQTSPDTIDPQRRATGPPWYITKSCSVTRQKSLVGFCQQAKGSFYLTVVMLSLFAFHTILALWSILHWKKPKPEAESALEMTKGLPRWDGTAEEKYNVRGDPAPPRKNPISLRSFAFGTSK